MRKKRKTQPKKPVPEVQSDFPAIYKAWRDSQPADPVVAEYAKARRETLVLLRAMRGALTLQVMAMLDRAAKAHEAGNLDEALRLASIVLESCEQEMRWRGIP